MSPTIAADPAMGLAFLDAADARYQRAATSRGATPGAGLGLGPIRECAADVPALIALARSGLLARMLVAQHDGWARRLDRVRELHAAEDRGGGLIVCLECSRPFETALWPCRTLQYLDAMPPP
ncbi:MAG: hypothetical protein YHS30scaffold324_32 [Catenulispora phage 69_17]|nr:MAG: hypothetical protein YHS30scaffold324_32 [Catenulispora phage 69_17]